jgi:Protein of unknown function (DUF3102)
MRHIVQGTKNHTQFDYDILSPQKRASIQKTTIEIKESLRKTVRTVWETGKKLVEVRSQVETSQFNLWLKAEFDWSRRTAYNFISVYEAFPEFSNANFSQINISISALYLLAAPSIHQATRNKIIDQALSGEYISHKVIQKAMEEVKSKQNNTCALPSSSINESTPLTDSLQSEIESLIPELHDDIAKYKKSELKAVTSTPIYGSSIKTYSGLRPAWNLVKKDLSLFWGDTASLRFIENLPQDAFVLAIPSNKWHHEWLLSKSRNFIILHQPTIKKELLKSLLSAMSIDGKAIIFPWLPDWRMLRLALDLNIQVYAGDPDLKRCENTLSKLDLNVSECVRWG